MAIDSWRFPRSIMNTQGYNYRSTGGHNYFDNQVGRIMWAETGRQFRCVVTTGTPSVGSWY